jgi:hypothetical protein
MLQQQHKTYFDLGEECVHVVHCVLLDMQL